MVWSVVSQHPCWMLSPCLLAERASAASVAAAAAARSRDKGKSLRASGRNWVSAERCEWKQCSYRHLSYRLLYIHFLVAQKQMRLLCIIFSKGDAELPPFMLSPLTCLITVGEREPKESQYGKNVLDPDIGQTAGGRLQPP